MNEEREYLRKLNEEEEDKKYQIKHKKILENNHRLYEYQVYLEKKKNEESQKQQDRQKEKDLTTLNFKSEEGLSKYKEHILKLNGVVESNTENYKQYMKGYKQPMHAYTENNSRQPSPIIDNQQIINNKSIQNSN